MKSPKIKICGNCYASNIKQVASLKPDYMGFIFYEKSPRFVKQANCIELLKNFPKIKKVAVFVNATVKEIETKITRYHFSFVQLHGDENPDFCKQIKKLGVMVIKAFGIEENFDFSRLDPYEKIVDYFLFDTKGKGTDKGKYGGHGTAFDWNLLRDYGGNLPIFLSGGLSPENIAKIPKYKKLTIHALDLNSRFEMSAGIKDIDLLKQVRALN